MFFGEPFRPIDRECHAIGDQHGRAKGQQAARKSRRGLHFVEIPLDVVARDEKSGR